MTAAAESSRGRILIQFIAKVLVSTVLVAFVLSRLSVGEIRQALTDPRWGWLLAAFAVYAGSAVLGAVQWTWILRKVGIVTPSIQIRRLYFIGLFFNNFLPANIGGDAYKIIDLGRSEKRSRGVLAATVLDRLIGLGALTALAVVTAAGLVLARVPLPKTAWLMVPILGLLLLILMLLLSRRVSEKLPGLIARLKMRRLADEIEMLGHEFGEFRSRIPWLVAVFFFSVGIQFLRMATHLLVAKGLGFALTGEQSLQLMVLVPMLAVTLTLPITINGIGLRESVSANLLTFAGLLAPQAVAMEMVAYLIQVVFSLQGGLLLWLGGGPGVRRGDGHTGDQTSGNPE